MTVATFHYGRRSPRSVRTAGALLVLMSGLVLAGAPVVAQAARPAAPEGTGSAVTVSGTGEFANLKITVGQTKNLINQVIDVSWTGGKPTEPSSGQFSLNYLQIMQCWGDDQGPLREQCEFGGIATESRGGTYAARRQVSYGSALVDPHETYLPDQEHFKNAYVPFRSVTGKEVATGAGGEFFDTSTTNEVPYARTRANGTGEEFFEVQTIAEAPGLGCGAPQTDATGASVGRSCWLVIVPRGATEVDGSVRTTQSNYQLESSPLSASNWANHLQVRLDFRPVGQPCPIGVHERRMVGQELLSEAMARWQPALCAGGGTAFGFSQVPDPVARRQVTTAADPGLALVSRPAPPEQVPASRPLVYAPVAVSGLAIALNIEQRSTVDAPDGVRNQDGQRITELNLTPRLVAKLLTQSYRFAVSYSAKHLASNPEDLMHDPEFRALNPAFDTQFISVADALLPVGQSDTARQLWDWLSADPAARAFLGGEADPWGMVVNPNYKGMELPQESFPKSDLYCETLAFIPAPLCTLDKHPYAADLHDAGRSASRGDTLARTNYDLTGNPPGWKKNAPQPGGQRAVLAVTDTATAARYGLATARLRNASGAFVAPTEASLLAGVAAMKASAVGGVLEPDPLSRNAQAYPLTAVTYATTAPAALDAAAGGDYATFLRYAAGAGQALGIEPGQLPFGYAPLPEAMRAQALAAAKLIAEQAGKPVGTSTSGASSTDSTAGSQTGGAKPNQTPGASPTRSPRSTASASPTLAAVDRRTPPVAVGAVRYLLAGLLILGGLAAGAGPVLLRLAARRGEGTPGKDL